MSNILKTSLGIKNCKLYNKFYQLITLFWFGVIYVESHEPIDFLLDIIEANALYCFFFLYCTVSMGII